VEVFGVICEVGLKGEGRGREVGCVFLGWLVGGE
jgi:hypothetical protein